MPVHPDRASAVAAYAEAARMAGDLLVELGLDEDAAVADFRAWQQAQRATGTVTRTAASRYISMAGEGVELDQARLAIGVLE